MKNNVKAHIRATETPQPDQTDGGALCDASCSASVSEDTLNQHPRWLRHHSRWNASLGRLDDSQHLDQDQ